MKREKIQIGIVAARDPETGAFLKARPIYAEVTPEIAAAQSKALNAAGRLFAQKIKQYIDDGGTLKP